MKKLLLLTMLLFTTTFLLAQDTIYLRNRQLIHGTIKRRNRSFIYYQRQGKIRNAPLLACALIDSIKYSNGLTWRLLDYTTARHEKKQLAVKQKKQRSRFDEPYVNRIAIGATNMDPVFILERLLGSGRGITPVIAAGITYERRIVKNNGSVFAISSFGLNRDFTVLEQAVAISFSKGLLPPLVQGPTLALPIK
ncbi:hypothetical protein A8C56_10375 [Niabella ginsenosidivorans]|uniref:Lipid/polyisoprenoid-binding YceI-like domain-containing protein n=1 Tax=Niabella ginsenosidivorans TaxID=1176587 RepID=A0A1A9I134_9BACT|nr:hypothetical protein [Niabella ginsenosidivorans]ANH81336.1 hypothetical protein A8C56_10375 [Niabella ginsenosidivorans]